MHSTPADSGARRFLLIGAAQFALVGLVVLVSRLDLAGSVRSAAIMGTSLVNGLIVALALMGVRRDGRMIALLALGVVVLIAGLLIWPSWDTFDRVRSF